MLTTILAVALLASIATGVYCVRRERRMIEGLKLYHAAQIHQMRTRTDAMRSQISQLNERLLTKEQRAVRDKSTAQLNESVAQLNQLLAKGDQAPFMSSLPTNGFAETIPAEGWKATEPFQHTRQLPIEGIIDGDRLRR